MIILKDQDIDVILGMNGMYQRRAVIDTLNRTIRLNLPDSSYQLLIQLQTPMRAHKRVCATSMKAPGRSFVVGIMATGRPSCAMVGPRGSKEGEKSRGKRKLGRTSG
jgi:hypothetical protein